jgi:hypothetical protein
MRSFLNEFLPHWRCYRGRNRRTIAGAPGQQHPWTCAAHIVLLSANEAARPDSAEFTVAVRRAADAAIAGSASLCASRSRVPAASRPRRRFDQMQHGAGLRGRRPVERMPGPRARTEVEWSESPRLDALSDILETQIKPPVTGGRAGVLINSDASGRAGTIRSFWSTPNDRAYCAKLITEFDLNFPIRGWNNSIAEVFNGESTAVYESQGSAFDALLTHIRFRFDPAWVDHYRSANLSNDQQSAVLCTALGYTAFIIPMLFALFLLLAAKGGAQQRVVNLDRLNRIRRHAGKTELLEHVEAFTSLQAQHEGDRTHTDANTRIGRRLHHVRGHLARRGYNVFWRSPHLRGNARLGVVRSRTVKLSFR